MPYQKYLWYRVQEGEGWAARAILLDRSRAVRHWHDNVRNIVRLYTFLKGRVK